MKEAFSKSNNCVNQNARGVKILGQYIVFCAKYNKSFQKCKKTFHIQYHIVVLFGYHTLIVEKLQSHSALQWLLVKIISAGCNSRFKKTYKIIKILNCPCSQPQLTERRALLTKGIKVCTQVALPVTAGRNRIETLLATINQSWHFGCKSERFF